MAGNSGEAGGRLDVAVIGTGIAGMSAAWLLSGRHKVTVYEAAARPGGHTNTLSARTRDGRVLPIDTGFIVYNEKNYPNLVALFDHLGVATRASDMSFAVSLDGGGLEYGSTNLRTLFAQKRNAFRPRFWSMLRDLQRFYREAPLALQGFGAREEETTLGAYLDAGGYGAAFQNDHLLPQAAAIWSCDLAAIRAYPVASFIRFFENHGLLEIDVHARPQWRTVVGGSQAYIAPLTAPYADDIRLGDPVQAVARTLGHGVTVSTRSDLTRRHDHVVLAAHANQALALIDQPTAAERQVLGAFRYTRNDAVLHTDADLMPRRRAAWSAWNYVSRKGGGGEVTYWMNRLQGLEGPDQFFVSLNPARPPRPETVVATERYEHPLFDGPAIAAQRRLWSLQGVGGLWFCGAHCGAGFHEDGLQSGLAVAEAIGGVRRPWRVEGESGRIFIDPPQAEAA
jgi:predicted NAD/FAD-binding protein